MSELLRAYDHFIWQDQNLLPSVSSLTTPVVRCIYLHTLSSLKWTRWDLNPGPSPRKGDDLPLIYEPRMYPSYLFTMLICKANLNPIRRSFSSDW